VEGVAEYVHHMMTNNQSQLTMQIVIYHSLHIATFWAANFCNKFKIYVTWSKNLHQKVFYGIIVAVDDVDEVTW
jgi:hypothetical protein